MKNILILSAMLLIISCTKRTPLQQLIHDADVVKVYVYSGNNISMHFETNDIDKIQNWKNFIREDSVIAENNCGAEGKIIFKTSDDSTLMKFSLKKGCTYVVYELNGKNYCNSLTDVGKNYIDSLMKVN